MSNKEQKTAPGAAIVGGGKVEKQRGQASSFSIANHTTAVRESQDVSPAAFVPRDCRKTLGTWFTAALIDGNAFDDEDEALVVLNNLTNADIICLTDIIARNPCVNLVFHAAEPGKGYA